MDKLYTHELFAIKEYKLFGSSVKLTHQIYLMQDTKSIRLCLFGKGTQFENKEYPEYYMCAIKDDKPFPLPRKYFKMILTNLRHVNSDVQFHNIFEGINEDISIKGKGLRRVKLSAKIQCDIDDMDITSTIKYAKASFGDNHFPLYSLLFYCSDGVDHKIHLTIHEKDLGSLYKCHFMSGLHLSVDGDACGIYYPTNFGIENGFFSFEGMTQEVYHLSSDVLEKFKFSTDRKSPVDIMDFLFSNAGFKNMVHIPEEEKQFYKWFMVIIPIENLKIAKEFGIGSVSYITKENEEIQRIMSETDDVFSKFDTFALVHINEYTLYKAYEKAIHQIGLSFRLLQNLIRDDSLCHIYGLANKIYGKTLQHLDSRSEISTWFYIESVFPHIMLFGNSKHISKTSDQVLDERFISGLADIEDIELQLLEATKDPKNKQTALFNSLKWVSKAWESEDDDDKIIYAIIALEFIIAREKGVPLLSKNKRKIIQGELLDSIMRNNGGELSEEEAQKLSEKFSKDCTDTPFMAKLRNLINRLSIPIGDREFDLIVKARDKRNGIVHGKNSDEISRQELRLLCEIISTIAMYRLKEEISKSGNN